MIKMNLHDISRIGFGKSRVVSLIMLGGVCVWQAICSCFAGGWDNTLPWDNNEGWTN